MMAQKNHILKERKINYKLRGQCSKLSKRICKIWTTLKENITKTDRSIVTRTKRITNARIVRNDSKKEIKTINSKSSN